MAYSNWGAFVYRNGDRRTDKEDVGVFDTDEAELPSGVRIYANILKLRKQGENELNSPWKHSHHGVMGDGLVRVACYKTGLPTIWDWTDEKAEAPTSVWTGDMVPPFDEDDRYHEHYFCDVIYKGYLLHLESGGDDDPAIAEMTEPDGTKWHCEYGYMFGAGFEE